MDKQTTQRQMRMRKRAKGTERHLRCSNCRSAIAQVGFQILANRHYFRPVFSLISGKYEVHLQSVISEVATL